MARTGLLLRPRDRETLRRAAAARMKHVGCGRPEEYLRILEREPGPSGAGSLPLESEWRRLVTFLTNPESHFFRDRALMALLRVTILPELISRNASRRRLSLWSAGCSTGQEPYSLAILIRELIPD